MSTVNLFPKPSSLIVSLRDIGYSLSTAVADIIDNSITAQAKEIDIMTEWQDGDPYLAIIDNGEGMSRDKLISAMRFGSTSPLMVRQANDLGRFGLGMKTASISQCRKLTVLSKQNNSVASCVWDLDVICKAECDEWLLEVVDFGGINRDSILKELYDTYLAKLSSGTIVLWEKLDRIEKLEETVGTENCYLGQMQLLVRHLEMTYHRFIAPVREELRDKICIQYNGGVLTGFNPFNVSCNTTIEMEDEKIPFEGSEIIIKSYVLPHHDKLSIQDYQTYAGEEGYLDNQGFYIYRNKRLIIKGTWFGLAKREELNKLIRIRVDIPNTLDHFWKIDIKKSNAVIPVMLKLKLKNIINKILDQGKRVYKQRGHRVSSGHQSPLWLRIRVSDDINYQINRDNLFLKELEELLAPVVLLKFKNYCRMLESMFPKDLFYSDMAQQPESLKQEELNKDLLCQILGVFLDKNFDMTDDVILNYEPFCNYIDIMRLIFEERKRP